MAHREDIRAYLEGLTIEGKAIDWGAGSKPVMNYVKGTAKFYRIDKNPLCLPDLVKDISTDNVHLVGLRYADHAFCMEVLEHVESPTTVLMNIYDNLKDGGVLHLSVPFLYPKHGDEDYWRFTDLGLKFLATKVGFKSIKVWEITDGYLMEAIK